MAISELVNTKHQTLKINPNAAVEYAKTQHLVNLRANEIAKAACDLPIFLARNTQNGSYTVSALTSFSTGQSLLVNNNQWQALYTPVCMQTQPLYLMTREANSSDYFIAIDDQSSAVNTQQGEALFDAKGNPSLFLSAQQKLLESDLKNDYQTYQFTQEVARLGLIKNIDIVLQFEQGETQTIQGLSTVDEDKLQTLNSDTVANLHKQGYLSVLNSMLISLFQLNALVKLHNQRPELMPLKQIKLELSRDAHAL
ncbi:SapC family protein [Pseudoalteromonas sp. NZS11]|uniref:SapC family protein n=1 Tax=Pseudoalteromonas sp. NZS11 TaxID=2792049 RepID=UPI0018CEE5D0|nr:SapC family protein [Pseudoalteromonas sp. NZS11]MBH0081176.1 SapC family protein [Pseudoalteromonas sp. NZS11]